MQNKEPGPAGAGWHCPLCSFDLCPWCAPIGMAPPNTETKDVAKWIRLSRASRAAVHGVSGKSTLVGTVHHRRGDDGLGERHGTRVEKVGITAATTIDIFGRERNNGDSGGGGGGTHGQAETVGLVVVAGDDDAQSIGAVLSLQTQIEAMSADKVSRWAATKAEKMAEAEGRKGAGTAEAGSTKTEKAEVGKAEAEKLVFYSIVVRLTHSLTHSLKTKR